MGGRGAWAERRRSGFAAGGMDNIAQVSQKVQGGGGGGADAGAGALADGNVNFNGVSVSGASTAEIKTALGNDFNREQFFKTMSPPKGAEMKITRSGNTVSATINYNSMKTHTDGTVYNAGFTTNFSISNTNGVRDFYGGSTFSKIQGVTDKDGNAIRASNGTSIRSIKRGISHGVNNGLIQTARTSAIGSGGSKTYQGSDFWAHMGMNAPLSSTGVPARPSWLSSAKTISDIVSSTAGGTYNGKRYANGSEWWSANRTSFDGKIDFRNKNSKSYKLASKFLITKKR